MALQEFLKFQVPLALLPSTHQLESIQNVLVRTMAPQHPLFHGPPLFDGDAAPRPSVARQEETWLARLGGPEFGFDYFIQIPCNYVLPF